MMDWKSFIAIKMAHGRYLDLMKFQIYLKTFYNHLFICSNYICEITSWVESFSPVVEFFITLNELSLYFSMNTV